MSGSRFRTRASAAIVVALVVTPTLVWGAGPADDDEAKLDAVFVTATRSPTLIRDEPPRVEARAAARY